MIERARINRLIYLTQDKKARFIIDQAEGSDGVNITIQTLKDEQKVDSFRKTVSKIDLQFLRDLLIEVAPKDEEI